MKDVSLKQIASWDSPSLLTFIENYHDYNNKSFLLVYAELKRRDFVFPDSVKIIIDKYCATNKASDLEPFVVAYLKGIGYNNYSEYYEKVVSLELYKISENKPLEQYSEGEKYPVLKTLLSLYKFLAYLIGLLTIISSIFYITDSSSKGIYFAVTSLILGFIVVISLIAGSEIISIVLDIEKNTREKNK
jgi:hypothetical protein